MGISFSTKSLPTFSRKMSNKFDYHYSTIKCHHIPNSFSLIHFKIQLRDIHCNNRIYVIFKVFQLVTDIWLVFVLSTAAPRCSMDLICILKSYFRAQSLSLDDFPPCILKELSINSELFLCLGKWCFCFSSLLLQKTKLPGFHVKSIEAGRG